MSGLCEVCLDPGACCKKIFLSGRNPETGERMEQPMSFEKAEHMAMGAGLPFYPSEQRPDGTWNWTCTQILSNGRCGIYESRPQLCKDYAAGSSPLCVHYAGPPPEIGVEKLLEL